MIFYPEHIKKLQKFIGKINYLDIGSREGIDGWFKLIENNLNTVAYEAEDNEGLFNIKGKKKFYLTKNDKKTSSFFRPNPNNKIYENELARLDYTEMEMSVDTLDNKLKDYIPNILKFHLYFKRVKYSNTQINIKYKRSILLINTL